MVRYDIFNNLSNNIIITEEQQLIISLKESFTSNIKHCLSEVENQNLSNPNTLGGAFVFNMIILIKMNLYNHEENDTNENQKKNMKSKTHF